MRFSDIFRPCCPPLESAAALLQLPPPPFGQRQSNTDSQPAEKDAKLVLQENILMCLHAVVQFFVCMLWIKACKTRGNREKMGTFQFNHWKDREDTSWVSIKIFHKFLQNF